MQWEGNYTAQSKWDTGDVEIHRTRYNQLRVNLSVVAKDGCNGDLEFLAPMPKLAQLYLRPDQREPFLAREDSDHCSITLYHVGDTLIVNEHDCSQEHGSACAFEGRYHRVK